MLDSYGSVPPPKSSKVVVGASTSHTPTRPPDAREGQVDDTMTLPTRVPFL